MTLELFCGAGFAGVVEIIQSKVEELALDAQVDVLVSEPMGTLLVNERMLETYLYARNRYLKKGGRMFPVSKASRAPSASLLTGLLAVDAGRQTYFFAIGLLLLFLACLTGSVSVCHKCSLHHTPGNTDIGVINGSADQRKDLILSGHNCRLQSGHSPSPTAEHAAFLHTIGHMFSLVNKALYLLHILRLLAR